MADERLRIKRADILSSFHINSLINAANTNDRFKLLEDDAVLPANLTNSIHPLFRQLEREDRLQLALQLASHFLLHDQLLEFFVPLLYGRQMHDVPSSKKYLCDPLVHASKAKRALLLSSVRDALRCLADRIKISFVSQKQQVWARTVMDDSGSQPVSPCCRAFQTQESPKIELTEKFQRFYNDANGYAKASRCARYRHDFLFATTLVHEVVHAVGVMRRGNIIEPYYRLNLPESEWGYAWENFMFGSIINPQDRTNPGTHILMRKVWAKSSTANANGGKEYCDVSMSWIAQWFRTETWNVIAEKGPMAMAPPITHFKIQVSHKLDAWMVCSDNLDVRKDIAALYTRWQKYGHRIECQERPSGDRRVSDLVYYGERTTAHLQVPNVPVPQRLRDAVTPSSIRKLLSSDKQSMKKPAPLGPKLPPLTNAPLVAAHREPSPCGMLRKRSADEDENDFLPPARKRRR